MNKGDVVILHLDKGRTERAVIQDAVNSYLIEKSVLVQYMDRPAVRFAVKRYENDPGISRYIRPWAWISPDDVLEVVA